MSTVLPPPSDRARDLYERMLAFMRERVLPAEATYHAYRREAGPTDHAVPPVVEELKPEARERGAVEPLPARRSPG